MADDLTAEKDLLSAAVRKGIKVATLIPEAVGVNLPGWEYGLDPVLDQEGVQKLLDKIGVFSTIVAFKYVLAQPIVIATVEADELSEQEFAGIGSAFDAVILEMTSFTAEVGGVRLGRFKVGGTKLAVVGVLVFVFFDHDSAARFTPEVQARQRALHFWKKAYVEPWMIDVPAGIVRPRRDSPKLLKPILDPQGLQQQIFSG